MRPIRFLAWAGMVTVLAGCADQTLDPSASLPPLNASATVIHSESKVPVGIFAAFIPCVPEVAVVTGAELHVVLHTTVSNSGRVSVSGHFQPIRNWDGIGTVTGDVYQAVGVTRNNFNFDSNDGFPVETTFVNNFRWIGPGPGNNLQVHATIHVTIDANGNLTANQVNSTVSCS